MKKFIAMLALVSLFGCGSSPTPPTTETATTTSASTGTGILGSLTPAQKASIIAEVQGIGADAVDVGLSAWAQQNNKTATEVAQGIHTDCSTILIPYLNGGTLPTADLVLAFIKTNVGKNLPPLVQLGLQGAALVLDQFVTIPNVALSGDQLDILKAFVNAIDQGAADYLAAPPAIGTTMKVKNQAAIKALIK